MNNIGKLVNQFEINYIIYKDSLRCYLSTKMAIEELLKISSIPNEGLDELYSRLVSNSAQLEEIKSLLIHQIFDIAILLDSNNETNDKFNKIIKKIDFIN